MAVNPNVEVLIFRIQWSRSGGKQTRSTWALSDPTDSALQGIQAGLRTGAGLCPAWCSVLLNSHTLIINHVAGCMLPGTCCRVRVTGCVRVAARCGLPAACCDARYVPPAASCRLLVASVAAAACCQLLPAGYVLLVANGSLLVVAALRHIAAYCRRWMRTYSTVL